MEPYTRLCCAVLCCGAVVLYGAVLCCGAVVLYGAVLCCAPPPPPLLILP